MLAAGRLARLFQILLALRGSRYPDARALAERCEVSRRTIYRDLDVLTAAGVPVRYRPEHRGYELAPGFCFDAPRLEEAEALALLALSAESGPLLGGVGLDRSAREGAAKMTLGLDPEVRQRVLDAAERIVGDGSGVGQSLGSREVAPAILQGMLGNRALRVVYRESSQSEPLESRVWPYQLRRRGGSWLLTGRSSFHRAVWSFVLSRIEQAVLTDDAFTVPPHDRRGLRARTWESSERPAIRLRFSLEAAEAAWRQASPTSVESRPDGRVEFLLEGWRTVELIPWVLSLGAAVEVIDPPELRCQVVELARQIVRGHQPAPLADAPDAVGA
jgi:predicted DNA-binding transcriptional regulator YafY